MSISINTSGGANAGSVATAPFSVSGVLAQDTILVAAWCNSASAPTCADGQGSYTLTDIYQYESNDGYGLGLFILQNANSGTHNIVITPNTTQQVFYAYAVYSGASATSLDGAGGAGYATATNPVTCSFGNSSSGDTVVSFAVNWTGSTLSSQSGTTRGVGSLGTGFYMMDQVQAGSGTVTPSFTYTTSAAALIASVGLKTGGAPPASNAGFFFLPTFNSR